MAEGIIKIPNRASDPTTDGSLHQVYFKSGVLYYKDSSGDVHKVIAADNDGYVTLDNRMATDGIDAIDSTGISVLNTSNEGVTVEDDGDVVIKLGDASSAQKLKIQNSSGTDVATISSNGAVTSNSSYTSTGLSPTINMIETDADADEGWWQFRAQGEVFMLRTVNDAGSTTDYVMRFARSGATAAMIYLDTDVYANGNVSAASFTDRTPGYVGDAISELVRVKTGGDGNLDHATLPKFAQSKRETTDSDGEKTVEVERDLGAMISVLTVAIQQLVERVEKLEAERGK